MTRSAHYMGAALCPSSGKCEQSTEGRCSGGVPLVVNGIETMLTAGHCTSSSYYNNGSLVGSQYTTSYPGNADIYGDWKLLYRHDYHPRTYSGGLSDQTTLFMSVADWGPPQVGQGICSSGSTTGQKCRFFVTAINLSVSFSGVQANQLFSMRHDSTNGPGWDTNGFLGGDSGGPCYYASGTVGKVRVSGIVKGMTTTRLTYYRTQLAGVRLWNLGATLATA
jgi:hypothetical protein